MENGIFESIIFKSGSIHVSGRRPDGISDEEWVELQGKTHNITEERNRVHVS